MLWGESDNDDSRGEEVIQTMAPQEQQQLDNDQDASTSSAAKGDAEASKAAAPGMSVQGVLYCRRGRSSNTALASISLWKTRFVFLSLHDGGSITIYKTSAASTRQFQAAAGAAGATSALVSSVYSSIHRSISTSTLRPRLVTDDSTATASSMMTSQQRPKRQRRRKGDEPATRTTMTTAATIARAVDDDPCQQIELYVPSTLPWIVKDMENDPSSFVVEIGDPDNDIFDEDDDGEEDDEGGHGMANNSASGASSTTAAVEFHRTVSSLSYPGSLSSHREGAREQDIREEDDEDDDDDDDDNDGGDDHDEDGYDGDIAGNNGSGTKRDADARRESYPIQRSSASLSVSSSKRRRSSSRSSTNNNDNNDTSASQKHQDELVMSIHQARKRGKPFRIYFCCKKGRHEKSLWLEAFSRLGRLSTQVQLKKSMWGASIFTSPFAVQSRRRATVTYSLARDVRQLELHEDDYLSDSSPAACATLDRYRGRNPQASSVEALARGKDLSQNKDKEYRVHPTYAYPHRWMTRKEMHDEMVLPSETYHNLRHPNCTKRQVGSLKVEVLQCLGLPKLDRTSMTDAIVYLVCGEYAFATDVIPNRANPMWLRKSRRACTIPIFHAYARLYVGVFDDDRKRVKDEFAGRVVIDLARLRPRSTYDVTLPLRLSTHVYSRRRRGAIRLRFSLTWQTERDALLSYIPKRIRIPLPQNSRPNLDVAVLCSDQKAFRNIAITVHGTNLPGKFTFQQMRAAIREINYTRKYIFTGIRTWIRETRHWQHPITSGLIFFAWMHCIYANQFSLVPAYLVLFFFFQLMRTYARYGIDSDFQQGFIPPSWEELMDALIRGGDPEYHAIEPLELGMRPLSLRRRRSPQSASDSAALSFRRGDYTVKTHEPKGKVVFKALGMAEADGTPADQLEFPFANGTDYPRFTVKESLVAKRGDGAQDKDTPADAQSNDGTEDGLSTDSYHLHRSTMRHISAALDKVEMPEILRNMELPDIQSIMRKDSSGLRVFDEEEANFAARHAVVHSGRVAASTITRTGRLAASTVTKTATGLTGIASELTEKSGLHHVVSPIGHTIQRSSTTLHRGISSGISTGVNLVQGPVSSVSSSLFRTQSIDSDSLSRRRTSTIDSADAFSGDDLDDAASFGGGSENGGTDDMDVETDQLLRFPQQNVDVEGPSTGKKITEDLSEIKEKVHEMTWNLFNDKVYHVKHRDTVYFGQSLKKGKRKGEVSKNLDKLLKVHQYSHPNPFVARMGLYVEPIIGSAYSFLLPFRAGFNLLTWRDPMLTFWVSVICGTLSLILFVFPWRIFLLVLGIFLVGPQNYAIRILREKGHLLPLPPRRMFTKKKDHLTDDPSALPTDQPVFTSSCREPGKELPTSTPANLDPREVHRVVVPYTPLMYQRFYDWPPEPQYAQVVPDCPVPVSSIKKRGGGGTASSASKALMARKPVSFALPLRRVDTALSSASSQGGGSSRFLLRRRVHTNPTAAAASSSASAAAAAALAAAPNSNRPRTASASLSARTLLSKKPPALSTLRNRSRSDGDAPLELSPSSSLLSEASSQRKDR